METTQTQHPYERAKTIREELAAGRHAFDAAVVKDLLRAIDFLDARWSESAWATGEIRAERDDFKAQLIEVTEALHDARTRLDWLEERGT